jgi:hypothetical protein
MPTLLPSFWIVHCQVHMFMLLKPDDLHSLTLNGYGPVMYICVGYFMIGHFDVTEPLVLYSISAVSRVTVVGICPIIPFFPLKEKDCWGLDWYFIIVGAGH